MYSSWAKHRRNRVIFWLSSIGFVLLASYITVSMYEPPSCADRKKNQDEVGVDCGGVCPQLCTWQVSDLRTVWARSFQVTEDLWNAVAYIENPNPRAYVHEMPYRFTLYNKENEVITVHEDSTFITPGIILPIFAKRIDTKGQVPYRTEFEWIGNMTWLQARQAPDVTVEEQRLMNTTEKPQLIATAVNQMPYRLEDVEVVAIVFDANRNAIASSKSYIDVLSPRGKKPVVFSWPSPFDAVPERWEIIVRIPTQEN